MNVCVMSKTFVSVPLLLAQADAEMPEVTVGNMLVAAVMLTVLAASLAMLTAWFKRWRSRGSVLPAASRQPIRVPIALTAVGVVLTTIMALSVIATALTPTLDPPVATPPVPPDAAVAANSAANDDLATEASTAAAETAASNEEETVNAPDSDEAAEDSTQEQLARETAKLRDMLWQTLNMNGVMFIVFGSVLIFHHLLHSGQSLVASSESSPDAVSPDAIARPEANLLSQAGNSPYTLPGESERISAATPDEETNPQLDGAASNAQIETTTPEPWNFRTELTVAGEAFLAAYLPTVVLRLLIVGLLPDAPSHPFLKMLSEGVDWNVVLLIVLMAVVVAPLVEELLYRVTILGGLWQHRTAMSGWIASSLLFAAAHGFPDSIALLPLSAVLGYVYLRRRSYRTVILIHFLFNGFNMTIAGLSML